MATDQSRCGLSHPTVVPANFDPDEPSTESDADEESADG
jgi:hypothetical protein